MDRHGLYGTYFTPSAHHDNALISKQEDGFFMPAETRICPLASHQPCDLPVVGPRPSFLYFPVSAYLVSVNSSI